MRKVLCLFMLISLGATAQEKTLNLDDFVHLEFSFEKGATKLTTEDLYMLGINTRGLYSSTSILIKAYYPPGSYTEENKEIAFARIREIRRFLEEESIPTDIIDVEVICKAHPFDLGLSYLREAASSEITRIRDTLIVNGNGYRIRCKSDMAEIYGSLPIHPLKAHETEGIRTISDKGDNLAALQILNVGHSDAILAGADTAYLYIPADEGVNNLTLSAYSLNPYTGYWKKIYSGARAVTLAKRKFYMVPFSGKGLLGLQYNLDKQAVQLVIQAPAGTGFLSGTLRTSFPDMVQAGEIPPDQKQIRFQINQFSEGFRMELQLAHASGALYQVNGSVLNAEIQKNLSNYQPGMPVLITLKKEHLIGEGEAANK